MFQIIRHIYNLLCRIICRFRISNKKLENNFSWPSFGHFSWCLSWIWGCLSFLGTVISRIGIYEKFQFPREAEMYDHHWKLKNLDYLKYWLRGNIAKLGEVKILTTLPFYFLIHQFWVKFATRWFKMKKDEENKKDSKLSQVSADTFIFSLSWISMEISLKPWRSNFSGSYVSFISIPFYGLGLSMVAQWFYSI